MTAGDETGERSSAARFEQSIFSLAFHLTSGNKNAAYDITVSSFVEADAFDSGQKDIFFAKLAALAVEKCRTVESAPRSDGSECLDLPAKRKKLLAMTKAALYRLTFESKTCLLLRDQLHLSYAMIARILKISEPGARIQTTQSRVDLRDKIEEILKNAR
jgi:hypothetical protein